MRHVIVTTALISAATLAMPVFAQDFVFDFKQPKNGAEAEPVQQNSPDYNPDIPLGKIVYMPGYNADSEGMKGWDNDPLQAQIYFYGAIAVSGSQYGWWADNFHTPEMARAHVLDWCNMDLPDSEPRCEIIAEIHPDDSVVDLIEGLSADGQLGYDEYLRQGTFKAFALSPNGAWGYSYDYPNALEATNGALETCDGYASEETNPTSVDSTCYVFDRNGNIVDQ
jgi:hypothetical protein